MSQTDQSESIRILKPYEFAQLDPAQYTPLRQISEHDEFISGTSIVLFSVEEGMRQEAFKRLRKKAAELGGDIVVLTKDSLIGVATATLEIEATVYQKK